MKNYVTLPLRLFLLITLLILGSLPPPTYAQGENPFSPFLWTKGIHLFAGGGVNTSVYSSNSEHIDFGLGLNLKTDLGYYLSDAWAIEASSSVKFNQIKGYLVWDTLLTLGLRHRFSTWSSSALYGRIFAGRAPTFVFLDDSKHPGFREKDAKRIRLDGPVYGLAFGLLKEPEDSPLWFAELAATVQDIQVEEGVELVGDVPTVVYQDAINDNSVIYSVYFTVGYLIF